MSWDTSGPTAIPVGKKGSCLARGRGECLGGEDTSGPTAPQGSAADGDGP